ncbi:MAG: hypothetical protein H7244_10540, partial [Herminiimonas sp.]|nr:hypothetical protein [Herminiimonas sp.]
VPDAVPDTVPDATPGVTPHLICTMREEQFRAILLDYVPMPASMVLHLSDDARRTLDVTTGDSVRCVKL